MKKIKELVNERTRLYDKFSDGVYKETIEFLSEQDKSFEKAKKNNTEKYTSFMLAYFVCKKFFNQEDTKDQDLTQKSIPNEAILNSNLNFHDLYIDLKSKKIVLLNNFIDLLETKELKITHLSNCFKDILLAKRVLSLFNFYFKEEFYFEALSILLKYHTQFLQPPIGFKKFNNQTTLDELLELKTISPEYLNLMSFDYSHQSVYLHNMDKKVTLFPGYSIFFKNMKLNNFYLVNKLLQSYHPGHNQSGRKKIKSASTHGAKLAYLIWDKQDLSKQFLADFDDFYQGLKNHPDFFNLLEITNLDDMKLILKNIKILKKIGYSDIFTIDTTKVMPQWSNNFVSKISELIKLDCNQDFPSFIENQCAPKSTIKLNDDLQFFSYKVSQVTNLQQLKKIGQEFNNCLRDNYGDENLTEGMSSFFIFRHDANSSRNFILEINLQDQMNPVREMLRKNNNQPTKENRKIASTFMVERLDILPQEFVLKFFGNVIHAIEKMKHKEAMDYLNNIGPFLLFFLKRSAIYGYHQMHSKDTELTSGHIKYVFEKFIKNELAAEAKEYDYKEYLPLLTASSAVQKDWVEDSISWLNQNEFEHTIVEEDIPF